MPEKALFGGMGETLALSVVSELIKATIKNPKSAKAKRLRKKLVDLRDLLDEVIDEIPEEK